MPNYKPKDITGQILTRFKRVILEHLPTNVLRVTIVEENKITIGAETINRDAGALVVTMSDAALTFPLLNPVDDSVVGTMSYGHFYDAVYSLHRAEAVKRGGGQGADSAPAAARPGG